MSSGGFDLHTHSLRSDGTLPPAAVVEAAAHGGLEGIALTDHDTTAGWDEARGAADVHGIAFIGGLELSTELDSRSVHLLGYWVDPEDAALSEECARLRGERERRARAIVDLLVASGAELDYAAVLAQAGDAPVGRPHIAAAMVAVGLVPDIVTAFDLWLADGGPAWVPKHALHPADGVGLIRDAGGAAVLAHPAISTRDAAVDEGLLDVLTAVGLDGVECDHPGHDEPAAARWRALAVARGLVPTGGSDFHGAAKAVILGERATPARAVAALQERATPPARAARPPGSNPAGGTPAGPHHPTARPERTRSW